MSTGESKTVATHVRATLRDDVCGNTKINVYLCYKAGRIASDNVGLE